ncbi:MAG: putative sulfate/molybdate transporter [Desulfobacterales bacterium]|jgi:SulP family sulfate permease
MDLRYRFNRLEAAGSLGDLGTLLPIAIGMILVNGLEPSGLFFSIGLFYILTGIYFGVTVPIQPMKVVGAYAIATGLDASPIFASGALMAIVLILIGATGAVTILGRYTPKSVVRGVQLSTGALLMAQGVKFMIGTSKFQLIRQAAEPYLTLQSLGAVPIGIVIGVGGGLLTLFLMENKKLPAGLLLVLCGIFIGLLLGTHQGFEKLHVGINLPKLLPSGVPSAADFSSALLLLVLPQIPMTLGNAVIAYTDLSRQYFGEASGRVTYRSACISMALANFISFIVGGMPLCHGAGGLAAHYRFGARTAGSNLIIGAIFVILAVLLGKHVLAVLYLMPMSILGLLLLFAGGQLALSIMDLKGRKELFVTLAMLGITLATNLAAGFIVGLMIAYLLKSTRMNI